MVALYVRNVAVFVVIVVVVVAAVAGNGTAAAAVAPAVPAPHVPFAFGLPLLVFDGGPKSLGDTLIARTSRFLAEPGKRKKKNTNH